MVENFQIYSDSETEPVYIYTRNALADICKGCINSDPNRKEHTFSDNCGISCRACKLQSHKKHKGVCLPGVRRRKTGLVQMPEHCKLAFLSLVDRSECNIEYSDNVYTITQLLPSQKHRRNDFLKACTYVLIGTNCDSVSLKIGKRIIKFEPTESLKIARSLTINDAKAFRTLIHKDSTLSMVTTHGL